MINTATPTLQIKISGIELSSVVTMMIVIRNIDSVIVKGNADIEVNNDIVSAFLTKEEVDKISAGNYNVSITAQDIYGEDVSDKLKVLWVKRGSMSKAITGDGSDVDMSDYYTKQEVDVLIQNIPGGVDGFSPIATVRKENGVTTISIQDKNGFTTEQVLDGADGENGITPHIGNNENWYIGDVDTGVKAAGVDGTDGFSPTITENSENNSSVYKLDITTANGNFTTPNLKGKDGEGGGGGSSGCGIFAFEIREDGHLWVISDSETQANSFHIDDKGHLIYELEG